MNQDELDDFLLRCLWYKICKWRDYGLHCEYFLHPLPLEDCFPILNATYNVFNEYILNENSMIYDEETNTFKKIHFANEYCIMMIG